MTPQAQLRDVNPDTVGAELATHAQGLASRIGVAVVITSTADLEQAVIDRRAIGDVIANGETFFAPIKKMAYDLHKGICDREHVILKPLKLLDKMLASAISDYKAARDREREEQERVLADEARRRDQTLAAEEAAALEAAGQSELAVAVVDDAINRPAPAISLPDPLKQIEGLSFRKRWCWRYAGGPQDVKQTPAPVLARTLAIMPREYLKVDESKVGGYVRAMKAAARIPGIDVYSVDDPVR